MSGFIKEFEEFAIKGNAVDLAVGVIIGAAFGKIVDSVIKDIFMPIISLISGGLDFSNWFIVLGKVPDNFSGPMTYAALTEAGVPLFAYGNFVTIVINFIILALIVFIMVRRINHLKQRNQNETSSENLPPPEEVALLRDIRDALQKR
ncbi:MAG: large conductance mechanosensitive channel protein MscL [Burkholderiales bacterium]|nr:large conductance mechanosensitive channel protein MscL [Burkholderiales bacterium]